MTRDQFETKLLLLGLDVSKIHKGNWATHYKILNNHFRVDVYQPLKIYIQMDHWINPKRMYTYEGTLYWILTYLKKQREETLKILKS